MTSPQGFQFSFKLGKAPCPLFSYFSHVCKINPCSPRGSTHSGWDTSMLTGQTVPVWMSYMANYTEIALELPRSPCQSQGSQKDFGFCPGADFHNFMISYQNWWNLAKFRSYWRETIEILVDEQTDSALPQVSLPWDTKVNRNRFQTYIYRHCQPTCVYHYCPLPPLISLTDAHIMRKAFDIFILYLLISRAYFFPVIQPVPAIKTVTCFLKAFLTLLTFLCASQMYNLYHRRRTLLVWWHKWVKWAECL